MALPAPPTWQSVYDQFRQVMQSTDPYADIYTWETDPETKQMYDDAYLRALAQYNSENGTNIAPDASSLGVNAPNQKGAIAFGSAPKGGWIQQNIPALTALSMAAIAGYGGGELAGLWGGGGAGAGTVAGTGAAEAAAADGLFSLTGGTGTFGSASATGTANALNAAQVAGMGGGTGLTVAGSSLPSLATMGGGTGLLAGGMSALGPTAGATGAGAGALSNAALVGAGLPSAGVVGTLGGLEAATPLTFAPSSIAPLAPVGAGAAGAAGAGGLLSSVAPIAPAAGGALSGLGSLVAPALGIAGGIVQGNAAADAARIQADAQIQAAKIAAEAARFKPVGVTTGFGSSKFGFDANGNLTSAGYEIAPWLKAQQDQLRTLSGGALSQLNGVGAATAPMGDAAAQAMKLGQGYLTSSPQEQAAKYMAEQQALLAAGRERSLADLQSKLRAQGRLGLATGGTSTGMMAANPEMEAYFNAQRQQDLELAAKATQGGMDYAKFGAGMVGTGGDLLKGMYGTQVAAYDPYKTLLSGMQTQEGMAQNALTLGMDMGKTATAASTQSGLLTAQGMNNAAALNAKADAYSPWAMLLGGAGQELKNYKWGT